MGANVNHRCRNGETAVFVACSKGLLACVRALVDAGADVGIARHVSRPRVLSCPRWILVRPSCHCRRARDVRRRCCAVQDKATPRAVADKNDHSDVVAYLDGLSSR